MAATPPQLTDRGAQFVCAFEGYSDTCYDDAAGICTVGYGHVVAWRRCTTAEHHRYDGLGQAYWRAQLRHDAASAALAVPHYVKVPLTRYQRDALISFVYNVGPAGLNGTHVQQAVNARPRVPGGGRRKRWREQVAASLLPWDHAAGVELPGLEDRREAEGYLFETGRYSRAEGNTHSHLER